MTRAALLLSLTLLACHRAPAPATSLDRLDDTLVAERPADDPALKAALRDQIMVDPDLVQQANPAAVRPPPRPASGAIPPDDIAARPGPAEHDRIQPAPAIGSCPRCTAARQMLTLGALAAAGHSGGDCPARIAYSAAWANRLPAAVPLYPEARVLEAAGADAPACHLRVVSFASSAAPARLLDWYATRTRAAKFTVEHGRDGVADVLAGTKASGAFYAVVRTRPGGGSLVDLMADAG